MAVDKIKIPPLEERVKHQRAIISLHSNLSWGVELEIWVIFPEESFEKLRFTKMELVEWIFLSVLVELLVHIECVCGSIAQVYYGAWGDILWKQVVHVGMGKCYWDRAWYLGSWDPAKFNVELKRSTFDYFFLRWMQITKPKSLLVVILIFLRLLICVNRTRLVISDILISVLILNPPKKFLFVSINHVPLCPE